MQLFWCFYHIWKENTLLNHSIVIVKLLTSRIISKSISPLEFHGTVLNGED